VNQQNEARHCSVNWFGREGGSEPALSRYVWRFAQAYNNSLMEAEKRQTMNLGGGFYQSMSTIVKTKPLVPVLSKELKPDFQNAKRKQVVWGPIPMAPAGVSSVLRP